MELGCTLNVADGLGLWVGPVPILFDYPHLPTRAEDIDVTLLWPRPSQVVPSLEPE